MTSLEDKRLHLQATLDAAKSQGERNRLGQFATPSVLANDIVHLAKSLLRPARPIRFMDPAFGTGAFYSALLRCFGQERIQAAIGYEIDAHYAKQAARLWADSPLDLRLADFTRSAVPVRDAEKVDLVVCNPPYVRHHHLPRTEKGRLQNVARQAADVQMNGLAGLYCYFLCICHAWMADEGLGVWLIPSEFMDVNYGTPLKEYLLRRVTLLRVHRFDPSDVQFGDALVSSAVVCFRKSAPVPGHVVTFTYGGSLREPRTTRPIEAASLRADAKWSRAPFATDGDEADYRDPKLSDFFAIKRGVATGANDFFILRARDASERQIPEAFLEPILPSPRLLTLDEIDADEHGNPLVEHTLLLLNCRLPEGAIRKKHPHLWQYLEEGMAREVHERYLCRHRRPWYSQERRPPAPFLCTYMGRRKSEKGAFRFILNHSRATAANVYLLLYPNADVARAMGASPESRRAVWRALQAITAESLLRAGRVYGGGLHKLEPRELGEAPAQTIVKAIPELQSSRQCQLHLFGV